MPASRSRRTASLCCFVFGGVWEYVWLVACARVCVRNCHRRRMGKNFSRETDVNSPVQN